MKTRLKNWLYDIMKALGLGVLLAAVLSAVLFILFGIVSGFQLTVMGNALRSGLLTIGALTLFVVAGLLLWTKGSQRVRQQDKWVRIFRCFGLAPVLLVMAVVILAAAGIVDYILRSTFLFHF